MSDIVIFDTSVLVDERRTGRHRKRIGGGLGPHVIGRPRRTAARRNPAGGAQIPPLRGEKLLDLNSDGEELALVWRYTGQHSRRSGLRAAQTAGPSL